MSSRAYALGTAVPADRTRSEIEHLLEKNTETPFLGRVGRRHNVDEDTELERLAYLKDEGRIRRAW